MSMELVNECDFYDPSIPLHNYEEYEEEKKSLIQNDKCFMTEWERRKKCMLLTKEFYAMLSSNVERVV